MENCPGNDGAEYILQFRPVVQGLTIAHFMLPFRFYNGEYVRSE